MNRPARILLWITIVYWIALFTGTHIPARYAPPVPLNDKIQHFCGYGGLAALLFSTLYFRGRKRPAEIAVFVLGLMMCYGAVDEWTQILVNRDCELADWCADTTGAAIAIVGGTLIAPAFVSNLLPTQQVCLFNRAKPSVRWATMFRAAHVTILACAFAVANAALAADPAPRIEWDRSTLRHLADGGYPRLIRLRDKILLLSCDAGGQSVIRRSKDAGETWDQPIVGARFDFGAAANTHLLELDDGRVLLFYNERPTDGAHPYTIRMSISHDAGSTWTPRPEALYVADKLQDNGCWEPAGVQLPSGELLVFFANENPYRHSGEQEITIVRSSDRGDHWSAPAQFSFRRGARDGMPVPLLLRDGSLVVAIEDEALTTDRKLKPVILSARIDTKDAMTSISGNDPRRWGAVAAPWPDRVYAGAPFIAQLPTGETLLSCQSDQGGRQPQMVVYVGDEHARHFANPSAPFDLPPKLSGKWNSLFVRDAETVIALSSTHR